MYGMVLMAAMTGTADASSLGDGGCSGCTGVVYGSCSGHHHHEKKGCHGSGIFGMKEGCHGGGLMGHHKHSCHGGCTGTVYTGCTGVVAAAPVYTPAPAPVAAPVAAPCCPAPVATCCPEKHKHSLFSGLKHKKSCCETYVAAPCSSCAAPAGMAPPAVTVPPAAMPMPMDKKDMKDTLKKPGASE